jgi:hypothetical protein
MNINPSLIMGLALAYVESKFPELKEYDKTQLNLRVYDAEGAGFHFVRAYAAGKWYYDENASDGHFNTADIADVEEAINAGGRVQIVGTRGQSFGMWKNWTEFLTAVS